MQTLRAAIVVALPLCAALAAAEQPQPTAFPQPRLLPFSDRGSDRSLAEYRGEQAKLETVRAQLAARWRLAADGADRTIVEAQARDALERGLVTLTGPWIGTPWDFYGTSEEPGRGKIACGVSHQRHRDDRCGRTGQPLPFSGGRVWQDGEFPPSRRRVGASPRPVRQETVSRRGRARMASTGVRSTPGG